MSTLNVSLLFGDRCDACTQAGLGVSGEGVSQQGGAQCPVQGGQAVQLSGCPSRLGNS